MRLTLAPVPNDLSAAALHTQTHAFAPRESRFCRTPVGQFCAYAPETRARVLNHALLAVALSLRRLLNQSSESFCSLLLICSSNLLLGTFLSQDLGADCLHRICFFCLLMSPQQPSPAKGGSWRWDSDRFRKDGSRP